MTKRWKRRLGYAALGFGLALAYGAWWVPWEYALVPVQPPDVGVERLDIAKTFPKGTRVTVVTAHPDDAEFYMGATLPQIRDAGAILSLVVVTDGDKGYYPFEDADNNRRVRRKEQTDAAHRWGAKDVTFLGFPDGRVRSGDELNNAVREALIRLKPEVILAFDDLYPPRRHHADHSRSGEAVAAVLPSLKDVRAIGRFSTIGPNRIVDVTETWDEKLTLMKVHASQFVAERKGVIASLTGRAGSDPFTFIQGLVERSAETDGARIDVKLGEGLRWSELYFSRLSP